MAMIPSKETKELLYNMFAQGFVTITVSIPSACQSSSRQTDLYWSRNPTSECEGVLSVLYPQLIYLGGEGPGVCMSQPTVW